MESNALNLEELIGAYEKGFLSVILCFPRLHATFALLPFMSKQVIPGMARNGMVLSLGIPLYAPMYSALNLDMITPMFVFALILKEVFVGLCMGFLFAISIWAVEAAGFFIDNQRGASMASSMNPLSGSTTSPLGILFIQVLAAFIFVSGIFLLFLQAIYESYHVWPVLSFVPNLNQPLEGFFLSQLDKLMSLAVILAGPLILSMFLSEMGLAFVNRFAPQLQVFFLAMPIKSGVGIFILIIYMPFLVQYVIDNFTDFEGIFSDFLKLL